MSEFGVEWVTGETSSSGLVKTWDGMHHTKRRVSERAELELELIYDKRCLMAGSG